MSRHRAIKNMVDDYYDEEGDYDDDYYDEDEYYEDDYDDTAQYYKSQPSSSSNTTNTTNNNNNNNKSSQYSTSSSKSSSSAIPVMKKGGVTAAPPGFGKPSSSSQSQQSTQQSSNITFHKPTSTPNNNTNTHTQKSINAITYNTNTTTTITKNNKNIKKGGVMAPPPGFGKPKSIQDVTTATSKLNVKSKSASTTTTITSTPNKLNNNNNKNNTTTPKKNRVMTPPPGFGRPKDATTTTTTTNNSSTPSSTTKKTNKSKTPNSNTTSTTTSTNSSTNNKKQISKSLLQSLQTTQKSRLSMVILGHVDAGKSTLIGQILLQHQHITTRTLQKYQTQSSAIGKSSFALAWIMDEDETERQRGVTIDVASKQLSLDAHDFMILDAPGHSDYVPAMISGAAAADVGLLVVAATNGEFESGFDLSTNGNNSHDNTGGTGGSGGNSGSGGTGGGHGTGHVGQTREHITLSRGLGVTQLIVAINKLETTDPQPWSQSRYQQIQSRLLPFLLQNGFISKRITFIPISGLHGTNILHPPSSTNTSTNNNNEKELASWYKGPTLVQAMNQLEPAKRQVDKPFRFIISDLFSDKGVVVKGRVVQGMICVGDKVVILPVGDEATIKWIDHGSTTITTSTSSSSSSSKLPERMKVAMAGDAVDLTLTGIDISRIQTGNILSDIPTIQRPKLSKKCTAKIHIMDQLSTPILCGSSVLFHMHSLDVPAVITRIISVTKKRGNNTTVLNRPRLVTGGSTAIVELKLLEKICMERFQDCRALGRFALRRGGCTVAVGVIDAL